MSRADTVTGGIVDVSTQLRGPLEVTVSACPSCLNPALRTESAHDPRCPEGFADAVSVIEDPRARRGRRHPLSLVVSLAAAAVAAGADSFVAIGQWAADLPRHLLARIGSGG
ncbi:MAG TPA: transposase family protein, partial [Dermatophilaceae bacterium]|nr:transposase family protein [Dermatophilaceae bacterium]